MWQDGIAQLELSLQGRVCDRQELKQVSEHVHVAQKRKFIWRYLLSLWHIKESRSDIPIDATWTMGKDGRFRIALCISSFPPYTNSTWAQ